MKISFFNIFKSITLTISFTTMLFLSSFLIVSFISFDHQNEKIIYQDVDIYQKEEVEEFNAYFKKNDLFLIVKFKKEKEKAYLLDYACHYYHVYNSKVYLEAINGKNIFYINVNQEGTISIT